MACLRFPAEWLNIALHMANENPEHSTRRSWLRPPSGEHLYPIKAIEEIALRAAEMKEFQDAVQQAQSPLERIRSVRKLLREYFPEIESLPEPQTKRPGLFPPASNEFKIAKLVTELLAQSEEHKD